LYRSLAKSIFDDENCYNNVKELLINFVLENSTNFFDIINPEMGRGTVEEKKLYINNYISHVGTEGVCIEAVVVITIFKCNKFCFLSSNLKFIYLGLGHRK
jgi:hypothetical protein